MLSYNVLSYNVAEWGLFLLQFKWGSPHMGEYPKLSKGWMDGRAEVAQAAYKRSHKRSHKRSYNVVAIVQYCEEP